VDSGDIRDTTPSFCFFFSLFVIPITVTYRAVRVCIAYDSPPPLPPALVSVCTYITQAGA